MDPGCGGNLEGPVALLLQVSALLDRIQLSQGWGEELLHVAHDHVLHRGLRPRLRHVVPEEVEGYDHLHTGVVPQGFEFPWCVEGVRLDDDASCAEDTEEGDRIVRRVRKEEGHAVPALHAEGPQARGKAVRLLVELPVRDPGAVEGDRGPVGMLPRGSAQEFMERDVRIIDGFRDALGPVAVPRTLQHDLPRHGFPLSARHRSQAS